MKRKKRPIKTLKEYRIVWTIELNATSPKEAARLALETQRDPGSLATVFQVFDACTGNEVLVDLEASP